MGKRKRMINTDNVGTKTEERAIQADRPFWQTEPCPPWCTVSHADGDGPDDRWHFSSYEGRVACTLVEPYLYARENGEKIVYPVEVETSVWQDYREVEPHIHVGLDHLEGRLDLALNLTLDETRQLAKNLDEALRLAETPRKGARKLRSA